MRLADQAKLYARQIFEDGELSELMAKDATQMSRDDYIMHAAALKLVLNAITPLLKGQPDSDSLKKVEANIDARVDAMCNGWEHKGGKYVKEFETPDQLLDTLRLMKQCGVPISHRAPSDMSKRLLLSERAHKLVSLFSEGRLLELG